MDGLEVDHGGDLVGWLGLSGLLLPPEHGVEGSVASGLGLAKVT